MEKQSQIHMRGYEQKEYTTRQAVSCYKTLSYIDHKDIMMDHPFDENFVQYGYEDVSSVSRRII